MFGDWSVRSDGWVRVAGLRWLQEAAEEGRNLSRTLKLRRLEGCCSETQHSEELGAGSWKRWWRMARCSLWVLGKHVGETGWADKEDRSAALPG